MTALRLPLFREITALLLLLALMLQSATAVAPGPAWWSTQNVLDPYSVVDDFAVANVGQLKYMAAKAAAAMEAALPGGAGEPINTMVADWSLAPASGVTRDNYLAINQGQLKHVATPFYVRLGLPYPWAGGSAVKDNYKLVNLGQLKYVFSFALNSRTVGQGAVQIPAATLAAALAQWQALPVKPVGSSTDDFDGDGIPNLQEYLMNSTLFDPLDIDGDRILDSIEDAHPGVLSKLRFADAVADYDGDGVMNFEEVLLGLNLTSATTSGRVDAMSDAKVLAWGLAARKPLVSSVVAGTDALKTFWGQIDAAWITANVGNDYLNWLDATVVNGVAKGLTAFRTDVLTNHVWEPWNPGAAGIGGTPSVFHDANGNTIDMDSESVTDFDRDADYLPDLWEYRYALNLRDSQDAAKDPDGDLLTNLQEYQAGTNPRLADSDGDGFADKAELAQLAQGADPLNGAVGMPLVMVLASGNFQTVTAGSGSSPLVVQVTQGGLPVRGAQVQFTVGTGSGSLRAANVAAATGSPVSLTTDANGTASAVYLAGASTGTAGVTATLGSSSGGSSANFTLTIAEASVTYAYESSNAAPFGGVVGAFGTGNVPRNNPFEEPTLLADSKYMNAAWEKWTDAAAKGFFKSYGNIGHSWDSGHTGVIFPAKQTDQTSEIVKRFNAEPWRFHATPTDAFGFLWVPAATYQHFYNKETQGPWYRPTSESEVQYRDVTALKVVTYVPQKVPAEMTFLALVYLGDSGWLPINGEPRGTLQASGVIRVKGSASTWSSSLDAYCKEKEGALIVDPGPEGERLIAKTENKHIRVELLPVEIKDVSNNQVITDTAWIKGHKTDGSSEEPEWPKLETRISGLPANMQVEWKLENRYPRRNGRDDMNIPDVDGAEPGVFTTGSEAWKIWETVQNSSTPYFGGDVKVKFQLHGGFGGSGTWNEVSFKVRGENPDDARCKAHIIANQGSIWYAWAIAKHESGDSKGDYNQFANGLDNSSAGVHGAKGEPLYAPSEGDGWGLFQRDSASGIPVTTKETWSWDGNTRGFINDEYPEQLRIANNYVDSVQRNNPTTFVEPQFTIKGQAISGRHVLALTWYNGRQGRPNSSLMHFNGSTWSLDLPNAPEKSQPYVHEIMDTYNGH